MMIWGVPQLRGATSGCIPVRECVCMVSHDRTVLSARDALSRQPALAFLPPSSMGSVCRPLGPVPTHGKAEFGGSLITAMESVRIGETSNVPVLPAMTPRFRGQYTGSLRFGADKLRPVSLRVAPVPRGTGAFSLPRFRSIAFRGAASSSFRLPRFHPLLLTGQQLANAS